MNVAVSDRLIQHLEERFPDKLPPHGTTFETLRELQGQRMVLNYIKSLKDDEDLNDVRIST